MTTHDELQEIAIESIASNPATLLAILADNVSVYETEVLAGRVLTNDEEDALASVRFHLRQAAELAAKAWPQTEVEDLLQKFLDEDMTS